MTERECPFVRARRDLEKRGERIDLLQREFEPIVSEWNASPFGKFEALVSEYGVNMNATVESKREISGVVRWFTARGFRVMHVVRPSQYSTAWLYLLQKRGRPDGEVLRLTVSPESCRLEPTGETREIPVMQVVCE